MTRIQKKILLFVFVTLSLWRLFEIPAISSAFWTFCTLGVLPGTNRVVPPNLVLKFLIMAFPLCLLLIFREEFLAAVPRRRVFTPVAAVPVAAFPKRKPKSPVVITLPVKVRVPFRARIVQFDRAIGAFIGRVARLVAKAARQVARGARIVGRQLLKAAIFEGQAMLHLWHVLEPGIRQFDHWLEITLHKSKTISIFLDTGSEIARLVGGAAHKVQTYAYRRTQHKS